MTEPGEKGVGVLLAESVQQVERPVSRELLPLPIPFPENEVVESERMRCLSRAVRLRVKRRVDWQGWANAGVHSTNEVFRQDSGFGCRRSAVCNATLIAVTNLRRLSGEKRCRMQFLPRKLLKRFAVLCLAALEMLSNRPPFKEGLVSLPDPGAKMADGSALLTGSDLEAWRDWRLILLRSPSDLHEVIAREGRVAPHY